MAIDPTSAIIQGGLGAVQTALGLINAGKTKREAEQLAKTRPQYQISPLAGQDLSLAKSELGNGMSDSASRAYNDLNNQQFSASLGAILKGGGGVNSIGDIYGNNQEGRLKLAMMKDNLRLNQIQNLTRASQSMQQEQQTKWQVNEFAPWQDKAQANAEARKGAQSQIWGGLNTLGSAAMNYGQQVSEANQFRLPTGVMGGDNAGFDNTGYASGGNIPIQNQQYPNAGTIQQRNTGNPYITPYVTPEMGSWENY